METFAELAEQSELSPSVLTMSPEQWSEHQRKERERLGVCPVCHGWGDLAEAGMFSSRYKCKDCNGTGKVQPDKHI